MRRVISTACVIAIVSCAVALGAARAQPAPTEQQAREARAAAANPSEAQARAAEEHRLVSEAAERAMRIERARRMAPIDLWFGIR